MGNHRDKKHHSSSHRSQRDHGNPEDFSHQHQLDPLEVYDDGYGTYPSGAAMSSGQVGGSVEYGGTTDIRDPRSPLELEPEPFPESHSTVHPDVYGAARHEDYDPDDRDYIVAGASSRHKGKQVEFDDDVLTEAIVTMTGAYNDVKGEDMTQEVEDYEAQIQEAFRQSSRPSYPGESSRMPSNMHNDLLETTELSTMYQGMSLQHQQELPQQRSRKAPKGRAPQTQKRKNRQSQPHYIDFSDFQIEPSWKFRLGAVLKMPWSQPTGHRHNETVTEPVSDPFYDSIRRFIIVSQQAGHSTAVAIYTYGRQGCLKHGVHEESHGIAYDENYGDPGLLPDEPPLGFDSVPIAISEELIGVEQLDPTSRINYAKLHTIEHNAPVKFIGDVSQGYIDGICAAVDQCWLNQKAAKPKGSGHKEKQKKKKWSSQP